MGARARGCGARAGFLLRLGSGSLPPVQEGAGLERHCLLSADWPRSGLGALEDVCGGTPLDLVGVGKQQVLV